MKPPSFTPYLYSFHRAPYPTKTCGYEPGQLTRLLRYVRCVVICSLESLLFGIARSSFTASGRWCGCTCACTCTRRASLRASAYVGTPTCAPVGVCGGVYAFVCEHVRARACVRACDLVFVEFSGDRDRQPAAATAETALRTSESPDGLASMGSLPPPSSLPPLPCLPCV